MIVNKKGCQFRVINLYAPHSKRKRKDLWLQIQTRAKKNDWILIRGFNMMENRMDFSGPSPLIKGRKMIEWRLLVTKFNFIDTLALLGKVEGSCFTRRRLHGL